MEDAHTTPLKLIALDDEDLGILSAHLQDAIVRTGDLVFLKQERRFAFAARRFDWEGAAKGLSRRRLTAVHFEGVRAVQSAKFDPKDTEGLFNLLALTFEPTEAPAGLITLLFSGGAAVRLTVEMIEGQMKDLGPMWEATSKPGHPEHA
jgi:hypothetical protein